MTMTAPQPVVTFSPEDMAKSVALIEPLSPVRTWIRHGRPLEDIDTEVDNLLRFDVTKQRVDVYKHFERLAKKYKLGIAAVLTAVLQHLATVS